MVDVIRGATPVDGLTPVNHRHGEKWYTRGRHAEADPYRTRNMNELPDCPECNSTYTWEDGDMFVCPECGHEWSGQVDVVESDDVPAVRDANGNPLEDGDTVTLIKDLRVRGSSSVLKVGTKVKNIRLVEGDHNIDCRIDGIGAMQLKSEFVRKA